MQVQEKDVASFMRFDERLFVLLLINLFCLAELTFSRLLNVVEDGSAKSFLDFLLSDFAKNQLAAGEGRKQKGCGEVQENAFGYRRRTI
jgi:hypothetical protein